MWPYDYFNANSNIEIDSEIERIYKKKKVFVALRYGDGKKEEKCQDKVYKKIKKIVDNEYTNTETIILDQNSAANNIGRRTIYRLEVERAKDIKKGDMIINILGKIIESTLIICDVSPKDKDGHLIFNDNVMFELGIALAWKMPEQVIILLDEKIPKNKLPLDIRNYNVEHIDKNYKRLKNIIIDRIVAFKNRKNIIIRNIKSKLDKYSLRILSERNGLMFAEGHLDIDTVRYLLNLGIIRAEIFPSPQISFGYCLTEIGKIVLDELRIKLYSDRLIDMYLVRFWYGYKKSDGYREDYFNMKKEEFRKQYGIPFDRSVKSFINYIPHYCKKTLIKKYNLKPKKYEGKLNIFNKYFEEYSFDFVNKYTVTKWEKIN